jgi:DHA3 family macrolide efflux protein-like MFS transporter
MNQFFVVWAGQLLSQVGSELSSFALAIWIYQITGSATSFALTLLVAIIPELLFAPFAGVWIDRASRKQMMLLSDVMGGCTVLFLGYLTLSGPAHVWPIYVGIFVISLAQVINFLAYSGVVTLIVPIDHLGRANGLLQFGEALGPVAAPLLAGILVSHIKVAGVLFIDCASYLIAVLLLIATKVPEEPTRVKSRDNPDVSWWIDLASGWSFLQGNAGLKALLVMFAITNFAFATFRALLGPFILSGSSAEVLGFVYTMSSLGVVVGGAVLSAWGGPKNRTRGIALLWIVQGTLLVVCGAWRTTTVTACTCFGILLCIPIINGCSQALWQTRTPLEMQARVFSLRRMVTFSCAPVAYILAGPLVDKVFDPLMSPNRIGGSTIGELIGVGPGKGISALFIVLGILIGCVALQGIRSVRLRSLDEELSGKRETHAGLHVTK